MDSYRTHRICAAAIVAALLVAAATSCTTTRDVDPSRAAAEEAIRAARAVGADQWEHVDMVLAEESYRIGNMALAKERADTAREKTLALKNMPVVISRLSVVESSTSTALATAQRAEAKADRAEANSLSALEQARQAELRAKEAKETAERVPGAAPAVRESTSPPYSTGAVQSPARFAQDSPLKDVFFAYDSSAVRADARDTLLTNAQWLKANSDVAVTIEGHCDERGSTEYNLALGHRRAKAAQDVLVASGITPTRISIVSYGKERPFVLGHDESAWRFNRRAHFVAGTAPGPQVSSAR